MSTCRGIDLSGYQGPQNWDRHRADGVRFAFIKATEGQKSHDGRYRMHMDGARRAGMVVGAYHFAWPNQDVVQEANNYIRTVRADADAVDGFVHWLDLEPYSDRRNYRGRTSKEIREWAAEWLARVKAAFPRQHVGVYAGHSEHAAGHVPAGVPTWFPRYPWRNGTYGQAERAARPNASGRPVDFWQFCGSPLDRSISYLSERELQTWARGGKTPAPAPSLPREPGGRVWTVRAGQTLGGIALALGVSLSSLVAYNRIADPDVIHPGQKITAPPAPAAKPPAKPAPKPPAAKPKPKPAPAPAARTYRVRPGDTLSGIAAKYRTTVAKLAAANKIKNPNIIFAGSILRIPA